MSQFYEGRAPRSLQRSNQPIEVPRTGITETLATPGLVFPETQVSRGQILFGQLERALGLGANLVGTAASISADRDREVSRLEAEKARLKGDIAAEERAIGDIQRQKASERLPNIIDRIDSGALTRPEGTTQEEYAESLVNEINDGTTDVERRLFRNIAVDEVIRALYSRDAQDRGIAQTEAEQEAREQDVFLRGEQRRLASEALPRLTSGIQTGAIAPRRGESEESFVERLISENNFAQTEEERKEFGDTIRAHLRNATFNRLEKVQQENDAALIESARAGSASLDMGDLERAQASLVQSTNGRTTETQASAIVGAGAAEFAAELAKTDPVAARDRFNEVRRFWNGRFPGAELEYAAKIESNARAFENQRSNEATNLILRDFGKIPLEASQEKLGRMSERMTGDDVFRVQSLIDNEKDRRIAEATRVRAALDEEDFKTGYYAAGRSLASAGKLSYLDLLPREKEINGKTVKVDTEKAKQEITDEAMALIEQTAQPSGTDPTSRDRMLARKIDFVLSNGTIPTEWNVILNSASLQGSLAQIAPPQDPSKGYTAPTRLPDELDEAYRLYNRIADINPTMASKVVKDRDTEALFAMARFAQTQERFQQERPDQQPLRAMMAALQVANQTRKYGVPSVAPKAVTDAAEGLEGWLDSAPGNQGYVESEIARTAGFYMRLSGTTQERALEQATEEFERNHTKINGQWVYTRNVVVPDLVKSLAPQLATAYLKEHGEDEGIRKSKHITLVPAGPNLWQLWRADINQPVLELVSGKSLFTTADLQDIAKDTQFYNAVKHAEEMEKRNRDRRPREVPSNRMVDRIPGLF